MGDAGEDASADASAGQAELATVPDARLPRATCHRSRFAAGHAILLGAAVSVAIITDGAAPPPSVDEVERFRCDVARAWPQAYSDHRKLRVVESQAAFVGTPERFVRQHQYGSRTAAK